MQLWSPGTLPRLDIITPHTTHGHPCLRLLPRPTAVNRRLGWLPDIIMGSHHLLRLAQPSNREQIPSGQDNPARIVNPRNRRPRSASGRAGNEIACRYHSRFDFSLYMVAYPSRCSAMSRLFLCLGLCM
ncbi:hypothetical protein C8Q80DRAFT_767868 [Daedaleopsis nitida]|nr:hypothetical protein C8Q80DRAFT_767868 [Daedaleopsis nitida]